MIKKVTLAALLCMSNQAWTKDAAKHDDVKAKDAIKSSGAEPKKVVVTVKKSKKAKAKPQAGYKKLSRDVSFGAGHYAYIEPNLTTKNGPHFMQVKGPHYAIKSSQKLQWGEHSNMGSNARTQTDILFYYVRGQYKSESTGMMDNDPRWVIKATHQWMRTIPKDWEFKYGLGVRYLDNDTIDRRSTTGHWGYDREQVYWFLPVSFEYKHSLPKNEALEVSFGTDIFLSGKNRSGGGGVSTDVFKQKKGWNVNASALYRYDKYFTKLEVSYWNVDDSNTVITPITDGYYSIAMEPRNNTTRYAVSQGIQI